MEFNHEKTTTEFSKIIKLTTLTWLMITLPTGNCKKSTPTLNCTISYEQNINETSFTNPKNTLTITSCPEGYKNADIIRKCEHLISGERPNDSDLFSPITNSIKNVTYWNKFCATCNNDTETNWQYWLPWSFYEDSEKWCDKLAPKIQRSEIDDLHELVETFVDQAEVKLRALTLYKYSEESELKCTIAGNWPIHLLDVVIFCLMDNFRIGQRIRLEQCQYVENHGEICTKMRLFLDGFHFFYKETDPRRPLSGFTLINVSDQHAVETSYDDVFYACEKTAMSYGVGHKTKIIISCISLIFIIAYLGINLNKRHFRSMVNKMMFSYMVGLIVMGAILVFVYLSYPVPCVAFNLAQFFWFYHFFWTLLISVEFCSVVCCNFETRTFAFYIYFVLGLIIPVARVIMYYYGLITVNENHNEDISQISPLTQQTCPKVPGYSSVNCTPYRDSVARQYWKSLEDILSWSFNFMIPALFIPVPAFALHYITKNSSKDETPIETSKRHHAIILTKMFLIAGIHWVLYKIYANDGNDYLPTMSGLTSDTIYQLSIDFHGIIAFVVFGIGNCINEFGYKFKKISQQDDDNTNTVRQSYSLTAQKNLAQTNQ